MFKHFSPYLLAIVLFVGCKDDSPVELESSLSITKYSYKALNTSIDSLQYNNPLELDLNNDGTVDYSLSSVLLENNDFPYLYLYINRKSPALNEVLVRDGEELPLNALWGMPQEKGFVIQENLPSGLSWSKDLMKAALLNVTDNGSSRTFGGEWLGKKDKYLGLKFIIKGRYHYGWLRISHNINEAKLAILDYAYNPEAGEPIKAGEK